MKLITYQSDGSPKLGAIVDGRAIALRTLDNLLPASMIELLAAGEAGMTKASAALAKADPAADGQPLDNVTLLPPVVRPGKVIALGRNYAAHAKEGGAEPPEYPMLFHKTHTSLIGAGGTVCIPAGTNRVDYEAELAVIIGKTCKNVEEADAFDYIAGYCCANDVTARDWQRLTTQFTAGKMVDTFGPLGPALVTKDEVPDPGNLSIKSTLNGNVMQDGNTKMMIFSVPFLVSYISKISMLEPGDVILTGTPEGVGYARKPPVYMKEGDVITIEVEGLGTLTNPVANA